LFTPDGEDTTPPEAYAIFTGHILRWKYLTNSMTHGSFFRMLVETPAATIDVVADPVLVTEQPVEGGVVSGSFWLSGRLVECRRKRSGMIRRILGGRVSNPCRRTDASRRS
jgi:hypothetical protein